MQCDDGLAYGQAVSEPALLRKTWATTQLENKDPVIVIPSVSPTSHRDNWISRRVALVCPGCRRDIPSADGGVSFGCGSEARGQKWDFQSFSVKLLLTPCDQKLENRSTIKEKERGVIQGEKTQQQQSLQYRGSLYFSSVWSPKGCRLWWARFQIILAD